MKLINFHFSMKKTRVPNFAWNLARVCIALCAISNRFIIILVGPGFSLRKYLCFKFFIVKIKQRYLSRESKLHCNNYNLFVAMYFGTLVPSLFLNFIWNKGTIGTKEYFLCLKIINLIFNQRYHLHWNQCCFCFQILINNN